MIESESSRNVKTFGNVVIVLTGGAALALSAVCYPFVSPALRRICLPFVPATDTQVANVFSALKGRKGSLLDIGSGDGRIVIEAARRGFISTGVELNYWLVLYSRWKALTSRVNNSCSFYRKDLWKFNLQPYQNVVIFGVEEMMADLNKKFSNELSDTVVIACRFPIPNKPADVIVGTGIDTVWVYHFKKS